MKTTIEQYNAAKKINDANALKAAGESLGDGGAVQYMQRQVGATRVVKPANTGGGQFDLDQLYQKDGIFYIVETKGPKATTTTRQVAGETVNFHGKDVPAHAIQGSLKYLDMTLSSMAKLGSPTRAIALQLKDALAQGKVIYISVKTVARPNGGAYFSVKQFKL